MENNKKDPSALVDGWLENIMNKIEIPEEQSAPTVEADEQAIAAAGLTHPDDLELEEIIREAKEATLEEESTPKPEDDADATRFFAAPVQPEEKTAPNQEAPAQKPVQKPAAKPVQKPAAKPVQQIVEEDDDEPFIRKLRPESKLGDTKAKRFFGFLDQIGITHIIATAILLVLVVTIGTSAGNALWLCASDLLALGKQPQEVSVSIDIKDRIPDIAEKLKDAGMIRYPALFEAFTKLTGKGDNILIGTITFNDKMVYDYNALINAMSFRGGAKVTIDVMIPEGYNCAQIFSLLEEKGVCSAKKLEEYAASGELEKYWFLDGVERGHKYCLEGFMFPDTYQFYLDDEPKHVIEKFLNGFDNRFSDRMIDKYVALNAKLGMTLSMRDVVTMASIVEKEKAGEGEGYQIASVFYNRLKNPASYPFLQSDATIKYDVNYRSKGELITDAQINASPYNTYTTKGLPAGPIANPGLASLDAALDPEDTDYFFFIFDKSAGVHRFSKTLAEHNDWARKLGLA